MRECRDAVCRRAWINVDGAAEAAGGEVRQHVLLRETEFAQESILDHVHFVQIVLPPEVASPIVNVSNLDDIIGVDLPLDTEGKRIDMPNLQIGEEFVDRVRDGSEVRINRL